MFSYQTGIPQAERCHACYFFRASMSVQIFQPDAKMGLEVREVFLGEMLI